MRQNFHHHTKFLKVIPFFFAIWFCLISTNSLGTSYSSHIDIIPLKDVNEISYVITAGQSTNISAPLFEIESNDTSFEEAVGRGIRKSFSKYPSIKVISYYDLLKSGAGYSPNRIRFFFVLSARKDFFGNEPATVASLSVKFEKFLPDGTPVEIQVNEASTYPLIVSSDRKIFLNDVEKGVSFLSSYVSGWICAANNMEQTNCE